jgi:hypothetical protein
MNAALRRKMAWGMKAGVRTAVERLRYSLEWCTLCAAHSHLIRWSPRCAQ